MTRLFRIVAREDAALGIWGRGPAVEAESDAAALEMSISGGVVVELQTEAQHDRRVALVTEAKAWKILDEKRQAYEGVVRGRRAGQRAAFVEGLAREGLLL